LLPQSELLVNIHRVLFLTAFRMSAKKRLADSSSAGSSTALSVRVSSSQSATRSQAPCCDPHQLVVARALETLLAFIEEIELIS
jgi:hypothetical protein